MEYWITNGVVKESRPGYMAWSGKCPKCGYVNNGKTSGGTNGYSVYGSYNTYCMCEKCGNHYEVSIGKNY